MALAHEHVLSCKTCSSPLFLTGLHHHNGSGAVNPAKTRAVIFYQHTVAANITGTPITSSRLQPMAEDSIDGPTAAASATALHVLHMEGFDRPATRRAFAEFCGLEEEVFEGHFEVLSRLTGVELGVCWCQCHAVDDVREGEGIVDDEEDDFWPSSPSPVVEAKSQRWEETSPDRVSEHLLGESDWLRKRKKAS